MTDGNDPSFAKAQERYSAAIIGIILGIFTVLFITEARGESGIASVYTTKHGVKTASGRRLNDGAFTAAHKFLPFGTMVRVINKRNGRSVVVTITDRGPYIKGRIIDLTMAGANAIGMGYGLAPVTVELVGCEKPRITGASLVGC